jgi:hypothetical protein
MLMAYGALEGSVDDTMCVMNDTPRTPTKGSLLTYTHPLNPTDITDDNYREIATELFAAQCRYLSGYALSMAERFSDDDTDYFSTALESCHRLMDISYDGSCEDLVTFLFNLRDDDRPHRESLADMISAGGLCDELDTYENLIYAAEGI